MFTIVGVEIVHPASFPLSLEVWYDISVKIMPIAAVVIVHYPSF